MRDYEFKAFTENHTKDILTAEKAVWYEKVGNLKTLN